MKDEGLTSSLIMTSQLCTEAGKRVRYRSGGCGAALTSVALQNTPHGPVIDLGEGHSAVNLHTDWTLE